ncbi:hypothetical protein [Afifella sp. IM 167]|uniref:hypothetical protein n=1 Tax=Afifella sp. IM 167 TaxID=2033586 RepID=UPI001CCBF2E5|nr:hypothetical protein [Afifella sp. IM 167]MBZ8132041.1 hypothetical protein [Afifella sp. IM 167]
MQMTSGHARESVITRILNSVFGPVEGLLLRMRRDRYRPERHYMRGSGPKSGPDNGPGQDGAS